MPVRALLQLLLPLGLLLAVVVPASAAGITILNLQDPVSTRQLGPSMQSWCDGNGTASLAEAREAPYQPVKRQQINFGYRQDACWFRVRFVNTGHDELALWLQVDYAVLDEVDFYLVDEHGVSFSRMGDTLPFALRPVKIRSFTLPFTLQPATPRTLYLRVHTLTSAMTVPVSLIGREPFIEPKHQRMVDGGFYGIALGLYLPSGAGSWAGKNQSLLCLVRGSATLCTPCKASSIGYGLMTGLSPRRPTTFSAT